MAHGQSRVSRCQDDSNQASNSNRTFCLRAEVTGLIKELTYMARTAYQKVLSAGDQCGSKRFYKCELMVSTQQSFKMVRETPELYRTVVDPYIRSFPPERIQWYALMRSWTSCEKCFDTCFKRVYNILDHVKEADRIIYEDPDEESGFIILPDL
jgi:hypothetical protein